MHTGFYVPKLGVLGFIVKGLGFSKRGFLEGLRWHKGAI